MGTQSTLLINRWSERIGLELEAGVATDALQSSLVVPLFELSFGRTASVGGMRR
jgi:hypothetical protein